VLEKSAMASTLPTTVIDAVPVQGEFVKLTIILIVGTSKNNVLVKLPACSPTET
jgi:hypothetical protein